MAMRSGKWAVAFIAAILPGSAAVGQSLYKDSSWSHFATDYKASSVGDIVTIAIYQSSEARNAAQSASGRDADIGGSISGGSLDESGDLSFSGKYSGRGETRRSGSIVAQVSAEVIEIYPNGDLLVEGEQQVLVNGEETIIGVRGRVRPVDISSDNVILSGRLANAEINYDGSGFVSRSARPGIVNRLFSLLGLG